MPRRQGVDEVEPGGLAFECDVAEDGGDFGQALQKRLRLGRAGGLDDLVAVGAKHGADAFSQVGAVLDQQHEAGRVRRADLAQGQAQGDPPPVSVLSIITRPPASLVML